MPPPPPRARVNARKILIFIVVALGLLGAFPALAQDVPNANIDLQVEEAGPDCLWVSYLHPTATFNLLYLRPTSQSNYITLTDAQIAEVAGDGLIKFEDGQILGSPTTTTLSITPNSQYEIYLSMSLSGSFSGEEAVYYFRAGAAGSLPCDYVPSKKRGAKIPTPVPTPRPAVNSCPTLLPDILIIGYASFHSQCRAVDAAAVGRADLVQRGVVAAVDIWYHVPGTGIGVCFRNSGAQVVFLDAAYSPRRLSTLNHLALPNGMTCALIRSAGTVVLLAS